MNKSKLLEMMFEHSRWVDMIERANEKHINLTVLKQLAAPQVRIELYNRIISYRYNFYLE